MFFQTPLHISWNWQLNALPKEIWPLISDTNRLFKDIKQPSIREANITQTIDAGFAQFSYNGMNRHEVWEEEPYEWEYPYRFGVKRYYKSGPYRDLKIQVDLKPNGQGTRILFKLWAQPRLSLLSALSTLKLKTIIKRRLKHTVAKYDKLALQNKKPFQFSNKQRLVRGGKKRLNRICESLHSSPIDTAILEQLTNFIKTADELELQRIRPYELAECWNFRPQPVLNVFLHAAKVGLLNFNWDLYCPECRTIQHSVKTLNQVHEPIFCNGCEQEFNVNFNKTIQLSFTPHPLIRKTGNNQYCTRGPQETPHIFVQQYLEPGEQRFLKTSLPPGTYTLKSSEAKGTAEVIVRDEGEDTVHIVLHDSGLNGEKATVTPEPNLSLENKSQWPQLITIEQKSWNQHGVSAAKATSSQLFRNLFSGEVLRKGEKISVDNLTLMFTDLFNSTGMYHEEGDDKALGQVIDHFDVLQKAVARHEGAIVKTIGDSVMAVFCDPGKALRAYIEARDIFSEDDRFGNDLQLRAGIHHGCCVAANLNSRIDYFGSTVNLASRFVDFASENEVIVSQNTFSDFELNTMLESIEKNSTVQNISTRLKGFDKESFPIKSIKIDESILKLAI